MKARKEEGWRIQIHKGFPLVAAHEYARPVRRG